MENQELSEKDRTAILIPKDSIMNIEVSGDFLGKCHSLFIAACTMIDKDKLKDTFENYKDDKEPQSFEEHVIFIMLPIIHSIEDAAKQQSKSVKKVFTEEEIAKLKESI